MGDLEKQSKEYAKVQEAEIALLDRMVQEIIRMVPPEPPADKVVQVGQRKAVYQFAEKITKRMVKGIEVRRANIRNAEGK